MQRTFRRLLASLMVVIMFITIMPMNVFAADTVSGTCGDNLTWTFDTETGELSIDGTGAMYDFDKDNRPWGSYEDEIKTVIIGESVTSVGQYAFYHCDDLTNVMIPESVTTISKSAFENCDSLISVMIPNSVTTIDESAFSCCNGLTNVNIPDSVVSIGALAFSCCYNIANVVIGGSVIEIGYGAFSSCYSIVNFIVDEDNVAYSSDEFGVLFNKEKTEIIQYPVGNERISYIIPDSVIRIGGDSFGGCESLVNVTFGNSIEFIETRAFYWCKNLIQVSLPDSVEIISSEAFGECTNLTNITIPKTVAFIGMATFYDCTSLTDVYYRGTEEEWKAITIIDSNEPLINATIHFNQTDEPEETYTLGDVNRDGKINSMDALLVLYCSVDEIVLEGDTFLAADVDCSGVINSMDALQIMNYSVGKIDQF